MSKPTHALRAASPRRLLEASLVVLFLVGLGGVFVIGPLTEDQDRGSSLGAVRASGPTSTSTASPFESEPDLAPMRVVEGIVIRPAVQKAAAPAEGPAALAANAEDQAAATDEQPAPAPFTVRIGSFNVLGSQHTAPGGDRRRYPPASVRSQRAVAYMKEHGVAILGTQELQDDQLRALQAGTGMAAYPGLAWGTAETDNSILWDPTRFELVSGDKFVIPFMGRPRPQPIVRLRELATAREFYVVNTHPSAHDGRYLVERRRGQATLVSVVDSLQATGLPVLVTGDMNDREEFYCRVVAPAGLVAPNGGSYSAGCKPPPSPLPVDWVVGSGVSWSEYWRDTRPVTAKVSDHFFISATAYVS